MWRAALVLVHLLVFGQTHGNVTAVTSQDCSLECIRQGGSGCEYCRISRADIKTALGLNTFSPLGSCIPWPCFDLLGKDDPEICQHFVHAPNDVKVEFVDEPSATSDTIIVSWKPSYYGIAFLRGFQVSLQALGGSAIACQLFLFRRNLSLPASHAQKVYRSDPFPGLPLGSQFAVTVMALPVPEEWEKFYRSKIFSTRSCAEKNGLEQCKKDWYPRYIEVQQEGTEVTVTFNLAPPNLGIRSYFSLCYANGMKTYTDITPNSTQNKTHHSYRLNDLQEGTNYTCEIAANEVDAVRKTFNVHVMCIQKGTSPLTFTPSVALVLPLCLSVGAIVVVLLAAFTRKKTKLQMNKLLMRPENQSRTCDSSPPSFEIQLDEGSRTLEEAVSLPTQRETPPRLLICYSCQDGSAHVKAVMQLGAFIQQHMATQVCLDLWDSLSIATEGSMSWYCRQIRECDFILVICSWGLNQRLQCPKPESDSRDEEAEGGLDLGSSVFSPDAAVQLIGEEVGRAKTRDKDMSKYMAAIFEYSEETDIPTEMNLVSQYTLPRDLALLFSHLHSVALYRPGRYLKINNISEEDFSKLPAGAALQWAIYEAEIEMRERRFHTLKEGDSKLTQ